MIGAPDGTDVTSKHSKSQGGRPSLIDDGRLLNRRDRFIQLLSHAWGNVGWELACARSLEAVRKALLPLKDFAYQSYEPDLRLFLRTTTIKATPTAIRTTRKALGQNVERMYRLLGRVGQPDPYPTVTNSTERLAESLRALMNTSSGNFEVILKELFDYLSVFVDLRAEQVILERQQKELETQLADQEAYFAQCELLKFLHSDKYAHNPRVLAQAIAGLPEVGCWQSFQRCEKHPSVLWPMERDGRKEEQPPLYYRIFQVIEECCNRGKNSGDERSLLELLRERICALPDIDYFGSYLWENWRYLRLSIQQTDLTAVLLAAAPFRLFGAFMSEIAKPRSAEEIVLARAEQRELETWRKANFFSK